MQLVHELSAFKRGIKLLGGLEDRRKEIVQQRPQLVQVVLRDT